MINTKSVQGAVVASVLALVVFSPAGTSAAGMIDKTGVNTATKTYVTAIHTIQAARQGGKLEGDSAPDQAAAMQGAFLKAKKAFHTARMDIQSIKKGDEDSRQGVPSFFDSEDDEEYQENEDEIVASN